ncbi:MAG: hypothetical protein Q9182_000579 [Xanthomendoza sp. 2 TL-2023]
MANFATTLVTQIKSKKTFSNLFFVDSLEQSRASSIILSFRFPPLQRSKTSPLETPEAGSITMRKRQSQNRSLSPEPSTVYIVRLLEGWRETQGDPGHISVPILGVFQHVIHANDFARRWLQQTWPARYQYGDSEPERKKTEKKQGGGIQLYILTDNADGSVMIDVERHSVLQGPLSV